MEEESQKQLGETPLYQPQFIVPLLLLLLLLSVGIILVLGRRITHLNGSNPSPSSIYWPSSSPSYTWTSVSPSPIIIPSLSGTRVAGEPITLQAPYIVVTNHEGVNQNYNSLDLLDSYGNRQTLDYFGLSPQNLPNYLVHLEKTSLIYLKDATHVFRFSIGDSQPMHVVDLSQFLTKNEQLVSLLPDQTDLKKFYLFLKTDQTAQTVTIRLVDLKLQTSQDLLKNAPISIFDGSFIEKPQWVGTTAMSFAAGYGDAGLLNGTYYLFNTETNKLTELATFASDADGLISATGQTIRVNQPSSRVIIMNNLSFELKSSDRESLPKSLADFLNYQDKGSLIQYSVDGTIQKQDIDFGQFLNIGPIEDQYATLTSAIQTIFYYDSSIYLQAKKSDGATYTTPMMADGYYQWRNGVWQTLTEATYQQAYRAYYTTSPDEVNLLAGDTQAYLSYEPDLGDVLATRDLLTGKQNDLLHQTGILTLLGVMRKE